MLTVDPRAGLTSVEAAVRLGRFGPNELREPAEEPWWEEIAEAATEPLQLVLIAVGILFGVFGEVADALTIAFVIAGVIAIEVASESRAKRALASLRALGAPEAIVVRDRRVSTVKARELVPGDVVLLEPGARVPADLRLVEAITLRVDESGLTGESATALKVAESVVPEDTALGDRRNMAFGGTLVRAGRGRGLVVATGTHTQLGHIAELTESVREPATPLQRQLGRLALQLGVLTVALSVLIPLLSMVLLDRPWQEAILTGLSLAFATIPEELPVVVTIVLALGAYELAQHRAITKNLSAAETLGSVSFIGTDKTGTLTQNRMQLAALRVDGQTLVRDRLVEPLGADVVRALAIGVLANDAQIQTGSDPDAPSDFAGDPTEIALLEAAALGRLDVQALRSEVEVLGEEPFDDTRKCMSVTYLSNGARWLASKGAPEAMLDRCTSLRTSRGSVPLTGSARAAALDAARSMAGDGLRVLALAERALTPLDDAADVGRLERELTFVGLVGLDDPLRPGVPAAVHELQQAGVRIAMLTGDHPGTARAVAAGAGIASGDVLTGVEIDRLSDDELAAALENTAVLARLEPGHKLRVVELMRSRGAVVAVTGDGVNDAPALRAANVGVAMGESGTEVAREAADLVLADDDFTHVATAVRTGRHLFANLRKVIRYYLAAKVAIVVASFVAVLSGLPVPFDPVQIIVMELFLDLGASSTFVAEPPDPGLMRAPPRDPERGLLDRPTLLGIALGGVSLAGAVLLTYGIAWWRLGEVLEPARSAAFTTWMVGHLVLAVRMRTENGSLLRVRWRSNRPYLAWVAGVLIVLILTIVVSPIQARLHLSGFPGWLWLSAILAGLLLPRWWGPRRGRGEAGVIEHPS